LKYHLTRKEVVFVARNELHVRLDVTDPTRKGNIWEIAVVATVLYRGRHAPKPPREVVFLVNQAEIERVMTDEESGQASSVIPLEEPGSYIVTAFVADLPGARATKRVSIKEEKSPTATRLLVFPLGKDGRYVLTIQVLGGPDGKQGVLEAPIEIEVVHPQDAKTKIKNLAADKKGTLTYRLTFSEELRVLRIRVPGTDLVQMVPLHGPSAAVQSSTP
jgi:hypothetical protein